MLRRATLDDVPALVELQFRLPSPEAVAMAGSAAAAAAFRARLLELALRRGAVVIVLDEGDGPIGFAELSDGGDVKLTDAARAAVGSMGVLGALRAARRSRARLRVDHTAPEGGVHLVELQVDPDRRNEGIGGRLLAAVEEEASGHVSLTTNIDNPARRLYERNGYEVVAEKRDAAYEQATGSPGRVLMVKRLPPPSR